MGRQFKGKQLSDNLSLSGSFSGSFQGDGSQLTGVGGGGGSAVWYDGGTYATSSKNLIVTGSISVTPGTINYLTASYAISASHEIIKEVSSSFADTASYINPLQQDVIITGSVNVKSGHVNIETNSYFLQGTNTSNGNVSLIGVNSSDQIYIGNQGYTNIIADDTNIEGDSQITGSLTVTGSLNIQGPSNFESGSITFDVTTNPISPGINTKVNIGAGSSTSIRALKIHTNAGYLEIGPQNGTYSHFQTDRPNFYFNKPIHVNGIIYSYSGNDLVLARSSGTTDTITLADQSVTFKLNDNDILFISSSELISGSASSTASFGTYIGDGSQLSGLDPFPFVGDAEITGSLNVSGSTTIQLPSGSVFTIRENDLTSPNDDRLVFGYSNGDPILRIISDGTGVSTIRLQDEETSPTSGLTLNQLGQFRLGDDNGFKITNASATEFNLSPIIGSPSSNTNDLGNSSRPWSNLYMFNGIGYSSGAGGGTFDSKRINIAGQNRNTGIFNYGQMSLQYSGSITDTLQSPFNHYFGVRISSDYAPTSIKERLIFSIGKSGSLGINLNQGKTGMPNPSGATFTFYTASAMIHAEAEPNYNLNLFQGNDVNGNTVFEVDRNGNVSASAYSGDGSGLTNVTGEWDGSHDGNASISGSLTLTGSLLNTGTVSIDDTDSPYTLTGTQQFVLIDPSGGDVTINMPTAATYPGRQIFFKLTQVAGANTVTLQGQGSDTIDGATTYTDLDVQYESISVVSNGGTGWFIF